MRRGDPGASNLSNFGRYYDPDPEYDPGRMSNPAPGDPKSLNFAPIEAFKLLTSDAAPDL